MIGQLPVDSITQSVHGAHTQIPCDWISLLIQGLGLLAVISYTIVTYRLLNNSRNQLDLQAKQLMIQQEQYKVQIRPIVLVGDIVYQSGEHPLVMQIYNAGPLPASCKIYIKNFKLKSPGMDLYEFIDDEVINYATIYPRAFGSETRNLISLPLDDTAKQILRLDSRIEFNIRIDYYTISKPEMGKYYFKSLVVMEQLDVTPGMVQGTKILDISSD